TLSTQGASLNTNIDAGRWRFNTVTGGPEEWVTAPLSTGLHAIGLHNVLNAGTGPSDLFHGEVGTFSVAPTPWVVSTPNATGKGAFHANSSLALSGLTVRGFGVSAPVLETNLTIVGGGIYTETFDAASAGLIDVAIGESYLQGMDLDLYLYRWTGSSYALVASSAGPTASEEVRLTMPQSGRYLILVDGFSVPAGTGQFDMFKVIIQGTQLTPTNVPGTGIPAGANAPFNVTWNFAGTRPGHYFGILFVGPTGAPAVEVDAGFLLVDIQGVELHRRHDGAEPVRDEPQLRAHGDRPDECLRNDGTGRDGHRERGVGGRQRDDRPLQPRHRPRRRREHDHGRREGHGREYGDRCAIGHARHDRSLADGHRAGAGSPRGDRR